MEKELQAYLVHFFNEMETDTKAVAVGIRGKELKRPCIEFWCDVNRLGHSGVNTRSAFVNTAGQLLLTWRGKA